MPMNWQRFFKIHSKVGIRRECDVQSWGRSALNILNWEISVFHFSKYR